MTTDTPNGLRATCAQCGETRFRWRIRRVRAGGSHLSQRTLLWTCSACGHELEEALVVLDAAEEQAALPAGPPETPLPR